MISSLLPRVKSYREFTGHCAVPELTCCKISGLSPDTLQHVRDDFPIWNVSALAGAAYSAIISGYAIPESLVCPSTLPEHQQGYTMRITPEGVRLDGADAAGLWYGLQTLRMLMDLNPDAWLACEVTDWPSIPNRGIHLDLKGYQPRFPRLLEIIELLSRAKINVVLLEVEDKYQFQAAPGVAVPEGYSFEQLRELSRYCAARQIQVMPKLQCLGHVDYLLGHEQYRDLREDGHPYQYCPRNPQGLQLWSAMAVELMDAFREHKYFHIGADEASYLGHCPVCREFRSADTFIHRVQQCIDVVKAQGKTPVMWEDILRNQHAIPDPKDTKRTWTLGRDAVLMYWVYGYGGVGNEFPFLERYLEHGLQVWGASGVSGCGPSWVQNVPPLRIRALNVNAWTKAAVEHNLQGVVATAWTKIASADPPAEPIEACWFTMLYAADSMWAGNECDLETFCRDAYRVMFGADMPDGLLHYLLEDQTGGLADAAQYEVPRNAERLRLLVVAARHDELVAQRKYLYELLHMYHNLLGSSLADYRIGMMQSYTAEFRRLLETCRVSYEQALEALAEPSTIASVIQSRFGRDRVLLDEMESLLRVMAPM